MTHSNSLFSTPLYRTADLRHIEACAADQPLMQRAGFAAANFAANLAETLTENHCTGRNAAILILAGPGNNGGDAFETARQLRERGFEPSVVFVGKAKDLPMDAADAYLSFVAAGAHPYTTIPEVPHWSLIIDGLFGIGLTREITEPYAGLIRTANALAVRDHCPLLALDCPSGLDADTGKLHGATICATHTITFIAGKPGLYTADGPDYCGEISTARLDLEVERITTPTGHILGLDQFASHLKFRSRNSHKGSYGNAGVLGGAHSMVGAALLAGRAALRLGSGRVYVSLLDEQAPTLDLQQPELMLRAPEQLLTTELNALACGPGMGASQVAHELLDAACRLNLPLLLDADALNLIAIDSDLHVALATRSAPTLLTPHPAEAARLLDYDIACVQADRVAAALELATRYNALIALKGCGTIIATPNGRWFINTNGNPGLATAGSGDVLTGLVTALLAQGWPPLEALLAGVHLHGTAADRLVAQGSGPIGLTAGELIDSARSCFNHWVADRHASQ